MIVLQEYITEISRYCIVAVMALFTLLGFWGLVEKIQKHKAFYVVECLLVFSLQLLMFMDLALVSRDMEYVFFYVFVQVIRYTVS